MPTKPPDQTELYARARARAFMGVVGARRWVLPVFSLFIAWVGIDDGTPWRMAVLLTVAVLMLAVTAADIVISRRVQRDSIVLISEHADRLLLLQVVVITTVQVLVFASTGGLASPLLVGCLPVVLLTAVFLSKRAAWMVVGTMVPLLWGLALVQSQGVSLAPAVFSFADGHAVQPMPQALTLAVVMTVALFAAAKFGALARAAIDEMVGQALQARDDALRSHAEQARELTTLSAEIAHELKNPLASIKGLAALIDRELDRELVRHPELASGKSLERLGVLRREVDRMQEILDEFLNFSRPLVPLAQRDVQLRGVVEHVVDLHEAMASERRVQLRVVGEARAHCDPRKLEQIVINLVQNALHVAPPGSTIELELDQARDCARLRVRDAGPGMDSALLERVFDPGVTNKEEGSGLGLTVARALARQHGGELDLGPRADGQRGCEAVLELPRHAALPTGDRASGDAERGAA